ncbi:MAG: FAD-dependent thymidylate synthase [Oscillospiraceae bacterium]|jgi:thymidylate synthase (FAD)|nr:FAD-dependent thymidylate synthase [Oscillospiraceae bacterium]
MNQFQTKVKIVGCSSLGEQVAAASGRISTQSGTASEILARSGDAEKNANLIAKVTRSGHNSVIEHAVFHIAFEDVSVFAEQFIIEFRLASYTVKSRRYVDFSSAGYYTPNFADSAVTNSYKKLMELLFAEYQYFCGQGIPKEDARFLLPYCLYSNFFCTVNARELLLMLQSMLFGRGGAFAELNAIGEDLLVQLQELAPGVCADFASRGGNYDNRLDFSDLAGQGSIEAHQGDKPLAELLACTPDASLVVAKSALIGANELPADAIEKILRDNEKAGIILQRLLQSRRPRALEHAVFTFRLNGVSLSSITHFTRHRMQSIELPLLTKTNRASHILPPTVAREPALRERYEAAFAKMHEWYEAMKTSGLSEEELVYCQLSGNTLDFVLTMNARELLLFFKLRTCNRAQWEIREYADAMLRLCRGQSPELFQYFGPGCYTDKCPEGPMSCGSSEMKQKYTKFE